MRYLDHGRELEVAQGSVLYEVGAEPSEDGVFLLLSGRIRLHHGFADGTELAFEAEPGSLFGLTDTFTRQPRIFRATALEDCKLYSWSFDAFERAISVYIELAEMAVTSLSKQMRVVNEDMKKLG